MIRILLAHPSRLVCDSMRTALDHVEDVYVVGCATTTEELYFLLPHSNVVLLGSELEDIDDFNMLNEIRMSHPKIKVLVMGVSDAPEAIIHYVEAGAAGYILQNESVDDMVQKLHAAHEAKAIISPSVAAAMMERLTCLARPDITRAFMEAREMQLDELTSREEEVLELITKGHTNQEIAERLVIECGTVKNHVHNILKKLEVNNRYDAASLFQMQSAMAAVA